MTALRLSIVIPALNESANLARLLPDLAAHEREAELLVVDGGSTDDSQAVVARVGAVRWLSAPRGRAGQMNAGARAAQGDVLLFLHADTTLPAGAGAAIRAALADPAVVGGRFDVRLDSRRRLLAVVGWLMNRRSRLTGICTGDQGIFVRRAVFEALEGYPDIPLMEDVELTRRLKRQGRLAALRAARRDLGAQVGDRGGPAHGRADVDAASALRARRAPRAPPSLVLPSGRSRHDRAPTEVMARCLDLGACRH